MLTLCLGLASREDFKSVDWLSLTFSTFSPEKSNGFLTLCLQRLCLFSEGLFGVEPVEMWLLLLDVEVDEKGGGSMKLKALASTTINKQPISIDLAILKRLPKLRRKLDS